ncbi:MAG: CPBP family intramembrane metalloprotease [Bacteroidetes bacterium]|nr:CPBP family intramembrane metalloprotease [Bacteroidota bacterium]
MKQALFSNLTPFSRLVFAIALTFSCFILFFFAALLLALPIFHLSLTGTLAILNQIDDPKALRILEYFQVTQSVGLFIIPPVLAGFLLEGNSWTYLKANQTGKGNVYFIVFLLMFVSLPFINWLVDLNQMMKLPEFLKGMEDWMKSAEEQAGKLTDSFLAGSSFGNFLFNIFMIGILPAVGEEFMFRGLLQKLLKGWLKNIHLAVFITGFLFALMHLQFYGLLPRMILGVIFGYLFYWSGSIWVPVFAHFVNNSGAIIISYLANLGLISQKYQDFGSTHNVFLILLSLLMTTSCLFMVYRRKPLYPS